MDRNGVLARAHVASADGDALRTVSVGASAGASTAHTKDENGVWNAVFDEATNSIRVVTA